VAPRYDAVVETGRDTDPVFLAARFEVRAVRVLGVTVTWAEVVPALALLAALFWAAQKALRPIRALRRSWATAWPAVCAAAIMLIYFFVPFEYGGAAGLNERIPMFASVLLLPYVALPRNVASCGARLVGSERSQLLVYRVARASAPPFDNVPPLGDRARTQCAR
jgi:hypothetical protein